MSTAKQRKADAVEAWIDGVEACLEKDRRDAIALKAVPPSYAACEACVNVAAWIADIVVGAEKLKAAAGAETNGGVSLTLQSPTADSGVSFRIRSSGKSILAVRYSEEVTKVSADRIPVEAGIARMLAHWVTRKP